MVSKVTIAAAGNTLVPAYLTLLQKDYSVTCEKIGSEGREERWFAEDSSKRFIAEDPLLLLGLVALDENRGERWQASDDEIESFLTKFGLN